MKDPCSSMWCGTVESDDVVTGRKPAQWEIVVCSLLYRKERLKWESENPKCVRHSIDAERGSAALSVRLRDKSRECTRVPEGQYRSAGACPKVPASFRMSLSQVRRLSIAGYRKEGLEFEVAIELRILISLTVRSLDEIPEAFCRRTRSRATQRSSIGSRKLTFHLTPGLGSNNEPLVAILVRWCRSHILRACRARSSQARTTPRHLGRN